jgi:FKBP-type peptidyl-prolyl cis-trans isomerase
MCVARSLFVLCCLAVAGCSSGPFAGYKVISPDAHFKLRMLGDGMRLPTDSDSIFVRLRLARSGDAPGSLYSSERWIASLGNLLPPAAVKAIRMHEGDSVSVIAKGNTLPWASIGTAQKPSLDTTWISIELSLHAIRSHEESRRLVHERLMARTASDEVDILARYFADTTQKWKEFMGVRYQLDPKNPKKPVIQSGQLVAMHYTAQFLDTGVQFDDTHRGSSPLTFRLGDPDQVVKGLEIAAHVLPPGGKGRFVIPSEFAFGAEGSAGGIVPPFTPVLYTIEAWVTAADGAVAGR